jgi:hypothetical protein
MKSAPARFAQGSDAKVPTLLWPGSSSLLKISDSPNPSSGFGLKRGEPSNPGGGASPGGGRAAPFFRSEGIKEGEHGSGISRKDTESTLDAGTRGKGGIDDFICELECSRVLILTAGELASHDEITLLEGELELREDPGREGDSA